MILAVAVLVVVVDVPLVLAIRACYRGLVWGPVFTGLVFAGVGIYAGAGVFLAGESSLLVLALPCLGGSLAEFAWAREFRRWRGTQGRPPRGWRYGAAFVAVVGFAFPLVLSAFVVVVSVLLSVLWMFGFRNFG